MRATSPTMTSKMAGMAVIEENSCNVSSASEPKEVVCAKRFVELAVVAKNDVEVPAVSESFASESVSVEEAKLKLALSCARTGP